MNHYRITKYNPIFRKNGVYTKNEWTSISDIGQLFENNILTMNEYLKTENSYVNFYRNILADLFIHQMQIIDLELRKKAEWKNNQYLMGEEIFVFIRQCLREECWAKLITESTYIHFGYDYYTYMGTNIEFDKIESIARKYGLFAEICRSPYLEN